MRRRRESAREWPTLYQLCWRGDDWWNGTEFSGFVETDARNPAHRVWLITVDPKTGIAWTWATT